MECPHCHQQIMGKDCPNCGSNTPMESLYCMNCGVGLEEIKDIEKEIIDEDDIFDPENRILCSDGRCTGIIVNNRCSECGKAFKGKN